MLYEIKDTSKVKELFEGWQETLIFSCLQNVMGKIYVTDLEQPKSEFVERFLELSLFYRLSSPLK